MSELVVAIYDKPLKAEEVRLDLLQMNEEHLADLDDALVAIRKPDGEIKLTHISHLTLRGAATGGFLGAIVGVILLNPVFAALGLTSGAVLGAAAGSLMHAGISEEFIHELAEHLKPGSSALCILVRAHLPAVLIELKRFGGRVLRIAIKNEDETRLRKVLDEVRAGDLTASEENVQ